MDIKEITHQVEKESLSIKQIVAEIEKVIVGQERTETYRECFFRYERGRDACNHRRIRSRKI